MEKTGDHTLLVLFSMGITKGKWGTLIDALTDFKRAYDDDLPLAEVLPGFGPPATTLRRFCTDVHDKLRALGLGALLDQIFTTLPRARPHPGRQLPGPDPLAHRTRPALPTCPAVSPPPPSSSPRRASPC